MRIVLLAGFAFASIAAPIVVDASPKYSAPINVTKTTTIKARTMATAPSTI